MAEEWASRERSWKTKYITESFETLRKNEIANAKKELTSKEYQRWFEKNRERFRCMEQKAVTARNWTLSLYTEVRASHEYARTYHH